MKRIEVRFPRTVLFFSADDKYPQYVVRSEENVSAIEGIILAELKGKLGGEKVRMAGRESLYPNGGIIVSKRCQIRRDFRYFPADLTKAIDDIVKELSSAEPEGAVFVLETRYSDDADNGENLFRDFAYLFARLVRTGG